MTEMFQGIDFYDIDSLLSEDERRIRDTVREWVEAEVLPIIQACYVEGRFPEELIGPMAKLGVLGANLPAAYGCAGMNNVSYGLIMQELERGDSGIRSFASVQGALVMYPILAFGSDEQRGEWLPALASGNKVGCFGLTEPEHGSDPVGMVTRARRTAGGWVLDGTKRWVTNGSSADVAVIWAQTGEVGEARAIRGFLVPMDQSGVTVRELRGKLSLRASVSSELGLAGVELPETALLPGSEGIRSALSCLTQARYGIVWGAIGAATACFDEALRYAGKRSLFGAPLGGKQLQQARLADMLTGITQGQLLALQLGRLKDRGEMTPQQVSLGKRANVDTACDVARETRRLLGANGILVEYAAMRHMANLESVYTYEGTHDVHTLILGQALTGEAAY